MRFVLDEDVAASCIGTLTSAGHEAWSVIDAGRSGARDVEQVIYAHEQNAVLVTHDRELVRSRESMPIGRYLLLTCREWEAADTLARVLPDIEGILERHADLVIRVGRESSGAATVSFKFGTEL